MVQVKMFFRDTKSLLSAKESIKVATFLYPKLVDLFNQK
jgi:hypothetical protein